MSSEFKAFNTVIGSDGFSGTQEFASADFRISKNLSQAIVENPGLKEILEEEVSKRLEAKLKEDNSAKIQEFYEAAKAKGREAGLEKAQLEMEIFREKLRTISHEILVQKQSLLRDHEELWCQALKTILEKCFVSRASGFVKDVSVWLSENLETQFQHETVHVLVAPAEFESFKKEWEMLGGKGAEFEADVDIREGEVRFRSEAGDVFFSPASAVRKLEEIIVNHFQRESE